MFVECRKYDGLLLGLTGNNLPDSNGGHSPQAAQVIRRMTVPSLSVLPFLENAFVPEHLHFFLILIFSDLSSYQLFWISQFLDDMYIFMINDPASLRSPLPLYDIPKKVYQRFLNVPFSFGRYGLLSKYVPLQI